MIIGAPGTCTDGQEGAAFLLHGPLTELQPGARRPVDRAAGVFYGEIGGLGGALAAGGDVDGDLYDDLLIGHTPCMACKGWLHLPRGPLPTQGSAATFQLDAEGPSVVGAARQELGYAVAGGFDLNGDGFSEVLVGAPNGDGASMYGAAYLHFGGGSWAQSYGEANTASADLSWATDEGASRAGASVAAAGDIDGDGHADLLVGAPQSGGTGAVYVMTGPWAPPDTPEARSLSAVPRFTGVAQGDAAGTALSNAMDLNHDGHPDLIVGAPGNDRGGEDAGAVFIFWGPVSFSGSQVLSLEAANLILMGAKPGDAAGRALNNVGDINLDGYDDLAVGAPRADGPGGLDAGTAYIFLGPVTGDGVRSVDTADAILLGEAPGALAGFALSALGDISGDGYPDIGVGAPRHIDQSATSGVAYVVTAVGPAADCKNADDADGDGVCAADCDDNNPARHPGARELCNGIDDDCDGEVDHSDDLDGDGFTLCQGDCDDRRANQNPGMAEIEGDGVDNNCDGHSEVDIFVESSGAGSEPGKPHFRSIQSAIEAAEEGAFISVGPGRYIEQINFRGKALTVIGREGAGATIIAPPKGLRGAVFNSGEDRDSYLAGLTITGAQVQCDGGISGAGVLIDGSSPSLEGLLISGNTVTDSCRTLDLSITSYYGITSGYQRDCEPATGGGVAVVADSFPLMRGLEIQGNRAGLGGGMAVHGGEVELADCAFRDNNAHYLKSEEVLNLDLAAESKAEFSGAGGGLYIDEQGKVTITDSAFEDNHSVEGGAILHKGDWLTVSNSRFTANQGYATTDQRYDGVWTYGDHETSEEILSGAGGAMSLRGPSSVDGCSFTSNRALDGGAIYLSETSATLSNLSFGYNLGKGLSHRYIHEHRTGFEDESTVYTTQTGAGGDILAFQSVAEIHGAHSTGSQSLHGGSIGAEQSTLSISNLRIDDASAYGYSESLEWSVEEAYDSYESHGKRADFEGTGGALSIRGGSLSGDNIHISRADALEGGALYANDAELNLTHFSATQTRATGVVHRVNGEDEERGGWGGALSLHGGNVAVDGLLVIDAHAELRGGALDLSEEEGGAIRITQGTLVGSGALEAGAIYADLPGTHHRLRNLIIAYGEGGTAILAAAMGGGALAYCSVEAGVQGIAGAVDVASLPGMSYADPRFIYWDENSPNDTWDLHLSDRSPAINQGDPALPSDADGSLPDMGAYGGPMGGTWDVDGDGEYDRRR